MNRKLVIAEKPSVAQSELSEMNKIRKMIERLLKEQAREQEIAEQKDKRIEQNI